MSQGASPTPGRRQRPRPPRINIKNLQNAGSVLSSYPPTAQMPYPAQTLGPGGGLTAGMTAGTGEAPFWPSNGYNPFASGNFMARGLDGFVDFTKSGMSFGEKFTFGLYEKFGKWSKKWFTHIFLITVMTLYSVLGALVFCAIEGRKATEDLSDVHGSQKMFMRAMHELSEEHELRKYANTEWNAVMLQTLRGHQAAVKSLLNSNKTMEELALQKQPWTFWNSMFYCGTIYTTIGYGHITPKTSLGQTLTIIYAIIGIPMFLILLADFGKLFTRGMKFLWAYVRRIYYAGTCRQIRKQQQVQDAIGGFNTVYDIAIRRPSHFFGLTKTPDIESTMSAAERSHAETPTSPYPETFEIDDEFNLPVSLASVLLISYILVGALVYTLWEDWTYFEGFYFVFISMSTIGFGDLVPNHPIFMMCSIIYLIFGLALTSMFINVVQIKLSDTFRDASAKIGATIGLGLPSELGETADVPDDLISQAKTPSEIFSNHSARLDKIDENGENRLQSSLTRKPTPPNEVNGTWR